MKINTYLKEIQYRIFFIFFTFFFNSIILYLYKEELIFMLGQHQNNNFPHFITTNLPEVFTCLIKLSIYTAFYLTFPTILTQTWFFFIPALYKYEYKIVKNFLLISFILYCIGSIITYTIFLPYCWKFFSAFELNYESNGVSIHLETRLHEYLNLFIKILFSLNIFINFTLFLSFFLIKFPITILTKLRKIIYLCSFIAATLLTPPDITSQIVVGISLSITYEIFLLSLFIINEYKKGE